MHLGLKLSRDTRSLLVRVGGAAWPYVRAPKLRIRHVQEREAIWTIQIAKYGRDPKDFDLVQLARATDGLTGSETENVFIEALYAAFDEENEPTDLTIAQVLTEFVPLSKLTAEQIAGLRNWAKGRARLATSQSAERKLRQIAA